MEKIIEEYWRAKWMLDNGVDENDWGSKEYWTGAVHVLEAAIREQMETNIKEV